MERIMKKQNREAFLCEELCPIINSGTANRNYHFNQFFLSHYLAKRNSSLHYLHWLIDWKRIRFMLMSYWLSSVWLDLQNPSLFPTVSGNARSCPRVPHLRWNFGSLQFLSLPFLMVPFPSPRRARFFFNFSVRQRRDYSYCVQNRKHLK